MRLQIEQRAKLLVGEIYEWEPLPPARPMMNATEIDLVNYLRAGGVQGGHRVQIAGQDQSSLAVGLPISHLARGLGHGDESDVDSGSHRHTVQLLFPLAGRDLIVHQNDEINAQGSAPPDHHLPVDEPVVDPTEEDGHQGSLIDAWPVAAARVAAS